LLTKGELDQFKEIYVRKFGGFISDEQALDYATNLLQAIKLTCQPKIDKEIALSHTK